MEDSIRFRSWSTIVTFLLSLSCLFTSSQSFTIRNVVGKQIVVLGKHLYTKLQEPMSHAQKYISTGMVAIAANLSFDGIKSAMNNQKNTIQSQKVALKTKLSNLKQNIIYQHRNRHSSTSFIREAVRNVGPSVVRIDCDCENDTPLNLIGSSSTSTSSNFKKDDKSRRLSGSGFVISEDGYIMTNAHVVEKAKSIIITLSNGRSFKANIIAYDELIDLAVLKIDVRSNSNSNSIKLKKVPLGDSSKLQAGDWLIAVGCPAALDFTVTLGIVSSPKRSAYEVGAPHLKGSYIQTDTSLNVVNSGGPLLNDYGEVVGINTMIRGGGVNNNNEGAAIVFAIPINRALEVFDVLKEGRKPTHAFFGLELTNITPDIARIYNENPNTPIKLPSNIKGALIVGIAPTSPAADAIFRQGDIITEINGVSIKDMSDAEYYLDKSNIGEYCHVKVIRGGDSENTNSNNNNNVPVPLDVYVVPQDLLVLLEEQQKLKSSAEAEEESIQNRNRENNENENEEDEEEEVYDDSFIAPPTITDRQKSSDSSSKDKAEGKNKAESNNKAKTGGSSSSGSASGSADSSTNKPSTDQGDATLKVPPSPPKWRKQTFKLWNHQR